MFGGDLLTTLSSKSMGSLSIRRKCNKETGKNKVNEREIECG